MRTCRQHSCYAQEIGELKPDKCSCRKLISLEKAKDLVKRGTAQWVITSVLERKVKEICPVCQNDEQLKKSCKNCDCKGTKNEVVYEGIHNDDIVLVSAISEV